MVELAAFFFLVMFALPFVLSLFGISILATGAAIVVAGEALKASNDAAEAKRLAKPIATSTEAPCPLPAPANPSDDDQRLIQEYRQALAEANGN